MIGSKKNDPDLNKETMSIIDGYMRDANAEMLGTERGLVLVGHLFWTTSFASS
ncbi:hypothetical protein GOC19_18510 [Sinorhizobium meliloti]|uniref:hypothetical protein n=1 Tax=Sinorhizobium TaxID=28105 RepID=UPI001649B7F5|nr:MULTISPECIES: hypothetical protein [Sinorhizobium]MDX0058423.1 hypothetical protein [Sinorhizobium meliloti]QND30897.1 hypothetical protein HB772_00240 [Sinorhizobium meliloti]WQO51764.1 hypothetical protein U8C36_17915 [Sinorhizobium medicae]